MRVGAPCDSKSRARPQRPSSLARVLSAVVIEDPAALSPYHDAWDALAVALRRPYCAPGWMLSWWQEAAPPGALLRVVVALEDGRPVAVAPFWAAPNRLAGATYRMLASGTSSRLQPLCEEGREDEVAALFASALVSCTPRPALIAFEQIEPDADWPERLARAWPGRRPWVSRGGSLPAPTLRLEHAS